MSNHRTNVGLLLEKLRAEYEKEPERGGKCVATLMFLFPTLPLVQAQLFLTKQAELDIVQQGEVKFSATSTTLRAV
jgi:hypothetical protein